MTKLLLIVFLVLACCSSHAQTKNFIDQPYVETNGNADTAITPDEIYIKIVISESDTKNKVSVEDLEAKMVDALKSLGINTEKDLTTSDVASNFKYYLLKSKDVLKTKQYSLKVTDAVTATKVIGQLEDLNIANTSIERVDYSRMEELKNVLKTKAVENARARALALIKPLNQTLGAAIYIGEENQYYNGLSGKVAGLSIRGSTYLERQQAIVLPKIDFEKIQASTAVNVKFILK